MGGDAVQREALLEVIDQAFDKRSWHGPNLMGSLRGVTAAQAFERINGRKTIWEQALHAAYWKQRVLNHLTTTQRFPRRGGNWPAMPENPIETAWKADLELLRETHQ